MPEETPNILKKIIARKHLEVAESITRVPLERIIELSSLADKTRGDFSMPYKYEFSIIKVVLLLKLKKPLQVKVYLGKTLILLRLQKVMKKVVQAVFQS
tara:strand:- start:464 stop:760 length:297 start_codon:yes stop_codon:yes gene_type:complete